MREFGVETFQSLRGWRVEKAEWFVGRAREKVIELHKEVEAAQGEVLEAEQLLEKVKTEDFESFLKRREEKCKNWWAS